MTKGQQLKDNWLKALRSGEYKQTTGKLRHHDSYCCLGVYAVCNGVKLSEDGNNMLQDGQYASYNPIDGVLKGGGLTTMTLWRMNDVEKKTFAEIADYIEQNVEFKDDI